jgi:hypothetical protein
MKYQYQWPMVANRKKDGLAYQLKPGNESWLRKWPKAASTKVSE